jgi:hypothetical protein
VAHLILGGPFTECQNYSGNVAIPYAWPEATQQNIPSRALLRPRNCSLRGVFPQLESPSPPPEASPLHSKPGFQADSWIRTFQLLFLIAAVCGGRRSLASVFAFSSPNTVRPSCPVPEPKSSTQDVGVVSISLSIRRIFHTRYPLHPVLAHFPLGSKGERQYYLPCSGQIWS